MKTTFTQEEYNWLARRLGRLTQAMSGRSIEQKKLIKETAAKFTGTRPLDATSGQIGVPLQRRHLRLLEEVQMLSMTAIREGTLKELDARITSGAGQPGYYEAKRAEAVKLLDSTEALLTKIQSFL